MAFEKVAQEGDLKEGELLGVPLGDGNKVCIAKIHGQIFAVKDECTHAQVALSGGEVDEDYCVECPLHGAMFDLRDGRVKEGPARDPVKTFKVKIEGGAIWVE